MSKTTFDEILAGDKQLSKDELLRLDKAPKELPKLPKGEDALKPHTRSGWETEAPKRAIISNLWNGEEKKWRELYIYGGSGKALRHWGAYNDTMNILSGLSNNETLLMQSGVPYGVTFTHPFAPRVAITNSIIIPDFANSDKFPLLVNAGLTVYGQMTAGSWIYIGYQGIVQGTYETIAEAKKKALEKGTNGRNDLGIKLFVSVGTGNMSGAQPLAAKMNDLISIIAEVDMKGLEKTKKRAYLDEIVTGNTPKEAIEKAVEMAKKYARERVAKSIGVHVNGVDLFKYLVDNKITPLIVTEQSSAHEIAHTSDKAKGNYEAVGSCPEGLSLEEALDLRNNNPGKFVELANNSVVKEVRLMRELQKRGAEVFDYGNAIIETAYQNGLEDAKEIGGFVPNYIRPLFCEGKGPFRWAALSNNPQDIITTDYYMKQLFSDDSQLINWLDLAGKHIEFEPGLPARVLWAGLDRYNEGSVKPGRMAAALLLNELYRQGKISAPVIVGRDHLDGGSVASYTRETRDMKDGSDAIGDFAVLNLLANASSGATWVSYHGGGGVGIGRSLHAGQVIVTDGTPLTTAKVVRLFHNDPMTGVLRHVSAGYDAAVDYAKTAGIFMPGLDTVYKPTDYNEKVYGAIALIKRRTGIEVEKPPKRLTIII